MSKLEKYLAKATETVSRRTTEVLIEGEVWKVQQLTLSENRACERLAERDDKFDVFRWNDARIVKATEHEFPWNDEQLKKAYGVGNKYELPAKLFDKQPENYAKLLNAVRNLNDGVNEEKAVDDLKNSSEPTEKQVTSVEHS